MSYPTYLSAAWCVSFSVIHTVLTALTVQLTFHTNQTYTYQIFHVNFNAWKNYRKLIRVVRKFCLLLERKKVYVTFISVGRWQKWDSQKIFVTVYFDLHAYYGWFPSIIADLGRVQTTLIEFRPILTLFPIKRNPCRHFYEIAVF